MFDEVHLFYGNQFFNFLNLNSQWNELVSHITKYRQQQQNKLELLDFDRDEYFLDLLLNLDEKLWKRLISNKSEYINLRKSLFPNEINIQKAISIRNKIGNNNGN